MIGTKLAHYEITSHIGSGGMGDVYQATDTKLGRSVAIKFLPDVFSHDTERVARFQREARVLASLNHSNIAAIHGLEEIDKHHFLVMELVPGETLADRIKRGAIPLAEAIPIARQIADALEAAHGQGIIHRDLKPANVKVREDGTTKVLDFGLAKAIEPAGAASTVSQSPTITTPAMTQAGVILGTAAYMSPEQAKGRTADKRCDIWAFSCVLYEMLTGRRAFEGEDVADTLAAVLRADPDWGALPHETPPPIVTLLKRCLEKDRRRRISDIAVAQFVLGEHGVLATSTTPATASVTQKPARRQGQLVVTAVLLAGILAVAWILKPADVTPDPLLRFDFSLADGQQWPRTFGRKQVAISPDGKQIVYGANNRLYRKSIGEFEPQAIPGTDFGGGVTMPAFSPDGLWVAFYSSLDGAIKQIPWNGGSPTMVLRSSFPTGISWSEQGIVFSRDDGVFLVSPRGGKPEQLLRLENEQVFSAQLLPAGDAVLFTLVRASTGDKSSDVDIVVQSLTGMRKTIIEGASDAHLLPSGQLVYAVSGLLYAVRFEPATQMTVGERVQVLAGVRRAFMIENALGPSQFSVSDTGTLVYIPGPVNALSAQRRALVVYDRRGTKKSLKLPPGNYAHPRVTRDGTRLAVGIDSDQGANISIYDLAETSEIRRLTLKGRNRYPVWYPDGQRITFQSDAQGDRGIFWQRADGGAGAERLTTAPKDAAHVPESWSPDGKYLLFTEQKGQTYVLHSLSLEDKTTKPFGNVKALEPTGATFRPDGRWVAYASDAGDGASPDRGIFIQPFPATGAIYPTPKVRPSARTYHPAWAPNGETLFHVPASALPFGAVSITNQLDGLTFGSPTLLPQDSPRPSLLGLDVRGYDILPDGRILTLAPVADQDSADETQRSGIRVVVRWFEELNRLVPAK